MVMVFDKNKFSEMVVDIDVPIITIQRHFNFRNRSQVYDYAHRLGIIMPKRPTNPGVVNYSPVIDEEINRRKVVDFD